MASPTTSTNDTGTHTPRIIRPLVDFLHKEASAGILIIFAAIIAIIWANSPWHESYHDLWNAHIGIDIGGHLLELNLREWINDLAMVLFFFVVGLEVKREIAEGELRDPRQAALPVIGAVGGMIVPAAVFALLNAGGEGASGWGIPMATDIALVIGIVTLLGKRAPSWAKIFLLALAIVDDIGAIIVIAIFYSDGVSFTWLAIAVGSIVLAALIKNRVPFIGVYIAIGSLCWFALHEAHIHPTLAGVAFGLLAPVRPRNTRVLIDEQALAEHPGYEAAFKLSRQARASVSIVEWLEHRLHPWSAFVVVPIFALANAGVRIEASELGGMVTNAVTWGVILGLVVGKTVGISAFTLLAVALKIGRLPKGVTPRYVIGAGALGGIGFTVSLFLTELAFGESILAEDARLGVVVASLAAALIGAAIMVPGHVDED
jgi:Na+:H+ antiporter, NhaA family